jgi:hypothetical protein
MPSNTPRVTTSPPTNTHLTSLFTFPSCRPTDRE